MIDTKVLLLRSEIHFTYHNEERATHSQVATTSIRRFPSQSKLTIDPKLLSACITLKYLSGNFLTLQVYLVFGVLSGSIILNLKSSCFFYTRYSSENLIHRYPSIYLFLKIEGLLLQMKYAEYCRNPQNLYLLRVTPVCLNLMMSFAVWLVYFAVYVNCVSQVTLCRSVLCRESVRSSGHFTSCRQRKKIQQINVERSLFQIRSLRRLVSALAISAAHVSSYYWESHSGQFAVAYKR